MPDTNCQQEFCIMLMNLRPSLDSVMADAFVNSERYCPTTLCLQENVIFSHPWQSILYFSKGNHPCAHQLIFPQTPTAFNTHTFFFFGMTKRNCPKENSLWFLCLVNSIYWWWQKKKSILGNRTLSRSVILMDTTSPSLEALLTIGKYKEIR